MTLMSVFVCVVIYPSFSRLPGTAAAWKKKEIFNSLCQLKQDETDPDLLSTLTFLLVIALAKIFDKHRYRC